jgi:hypothetical protein
MPDNTVDSEISRAVDVLRRYLPEHPEAADTLEGIAQWWFANEPVKASALQAALERLFQEGVLATRRLPSGETLWYARPAGATPESDETPG